ncbi:MAP microtubule affinity-regulating kinase 1 [Blyttiomyces sp. JEL0837]|nr:MAP microtubule affinity-regulating kinase 1 [Blyttiomyces sp. JEL0837]
MGDSSNLLVEPTTATTGGEPNRSRSGSVHSNSADKESNHPDGEGSGTEKGHSSSHHQEKHKYVGNYEILKTIGEGSFAKVKLAIHRFTNHKVAIKVIDKEKLPDEYSLKNIHREAQIMRMLDHPNIIQLFEVMETKRELFLVLEYAAGGEVLDFIVSHGRLKEKQARVFMSQIVSALEFCHGIGIVHRDLKAENLLLADDGTIKISDFGLSNMFNVGSTLSTFCGSPVYSAPELIEGKKYVGPEVDAWSLGINLYAMVVGDLPFADSNLSALYESIVKCNYLLPDYLSPECKDLISKLLVVNPKRRLACSQVREHPWMAYGSSIMLEPTEAPKAQALRPNTEAELDEEIMDQIAQMGFEVKTAIASIVGKKFNQAAGTYYIMAAQKRADAVKFTKDSEARRDVLSQAQMDHNSDDEDGTAKKNEDHGDGVTSERLAHMMIQWERRTAGGGESLDPGGGSSLKDPSHPMKKSTAVTDKTAKGGLRRVGGGRFKTVAPTDGGEQPHMVAVPLVYANSFSEKSGNRDHEDEKPAQQVIIGPGLLPVENTGKARQKSLISGQDVQQALSLQQGAVLVPVMNIDASEDSKPVQGEPPSWAEYGSTSTSSKLASPTGQRKKSELKGITGGEATKQAPLMSLGSSEEIKPHESPNTAAQRKKSEIPSALPPPPGQLTKQSRSKNNSTILPPIPTATEAGSSLKPSQGGTLDLAGSGGSDTSLGHTSTTNASEPTPTKAGLKHGKSTRKKNTQTMPVDPNLYLDPTQDVDADGKPVGDLGFPGLRIIRFAFNCQMTTSLAPDVLMEKLKKIMEKNDISFRVEAFMMDCYWGDVKFETEICKIPKMKSFGIRMKRLTGDMWDYKNLCGKITSEVEGVSSI